MPAHRISAERLKARGSWHAPREEQSSPLAPSAEINPPHDLPAEAAAVWAASAPALIRAGLLTEADTLSFARYCRLYAAWQAAMQTVEADVTAASVTTLKKLEDMVRRAGAEFGLTPASRARNDFVVPTASEKSRFFETR